MKYLIEYLNLYKLDDYSASIKFECMANFWSDLSENQHISIDP